MNRNAACPVAAGRAVGRDGASFGKEPGLAGPRAYPRPVANPRRDRTITTDHVHAMLRAGRFYLLSLVYGAAVYGFVVAYLLALGAMTEPMPAY
jgi:hypothetical protein